MIHRPSILFVHPNIDKEIANIKSLFVQNDIELLFCSNPQMLPKKLVFDIPSIVVTIKENIETEFYDILNSFGPRINQKWYEYGTFSDIATNKDNIINNATYCYINGDLEPFFSICVPMYKASFEQVETLWHSIKSQTFQNWELIFYDTCSSHMASHLMQILAANDPRIHYHINDDPNAEGNIGRTKYNCFSFASGEYLIEMDHDDELVPLCLETIFYAIKKSFIKNLPEFVYSNCWERIVQSNTPVDYGKTYAFGLGTKINKLNASYKDVFENDDINIYNLDAYNNTPQITLKALEHIVSIPNHLRMWKRSFYHSIGGHNKSLAICDDYELILRTIANITERPLYIELPLYVQNMDGTNSQEEVRDFIQKLVPQIHQKYAKALEAKFVDFGIVSKNIVEEERVLPINLSYE